MSFLAIDIKQGQKRPQICHKRERETESERETKRDKKHDMTLKRLPKVNPQI